MSKLIYDLFCFLFSINVIMIMMCDYIVVTSAFTVAPVVAISSSSLKISQKIIYQSSCGYDTSRLYSIDPRNKNMDDNDDEDNMAEDEEVLSFKNYDDTKKCKTFDSITSKYNTCSDMNNQVNGNDKNSIEKIEVEAAREKLESLMISPRSNSQIMNDKFENNYEEENELFNMYKVVSLLQPYLDSNSLEEISHLPPMSSPIPITSTEQEYLYKEMELLKQLEHDEGDSVLDEIYNHWFHEKGSGVAQILENADYFIGEGMKQNNKKKNGYNFCWSHAEDLLLDLIKQYGIVGWIEPMHCLASLWYLQGRYVEAEILYKWVITQKPWHCGALSGLVRVYEAQKSKRYKKLACKWASRRLPKYSKHNQNRRRVLWVQKALIKAREAFRKKVTGTSKNTNNFTTADYSDDITTLINRYNDDDKDLNNNDFNDKKRKQTIHNNDNDNCKDCCDMYDDGTINNCENVWQ